MEKVNAIKLFEEKQIRSEWNDVVEEWYFSLVDVIEVLTESANPTDYLKKLRKRDLILGEYIGTNCPQVTMLTETGKQRRTLAANTEQLFRIIQSIPSKKAEPFKLWLAQIAKIRLDQLEDPELSIEQAMTDYKRLGYSDNWINQRLKSLEIRKSLTDEWKRLGLQEGVSFAVLTDIIYKTWADKTNKEYKQFKGLKKENLRDNMTNKELVLSMLAEISTKEISESTNPESFPEHKDVAKRGGNIAKEARLRLEEETGKKVISPLNAKSMRAIENKKNNNLDIKEQIKKYTDSLLEPKRSEIEELHNHILQLLPNSKLWFLDGKDDTGKIVSNPNIGYGLRTIKYADGKTKAFFQIGISANTTGISVYIMGIEDKKYLPETYGKTIGKATVTGYCIKFKTLKDINMNTLDEAIQDGVELTK